MFEKIMILFVIVVIYGGVGIILCEVMDIDIECWYCVEFIVIL